MERQLHTPRRKLQASGPFCPGTLWPPALVTPHSPASEALNHSIACAAGTAGSAGTHSLAGDACAAPLLRPASSQQASTSWLLDPRLPLAPDIAQALPASLPPLSKPSPSPHLACTSAQTRSLYSQFLAEGFSTQDPQAASVQLPPVCGGATPPSRGGPDSRCDDSVAITHSHRQTWDWTHGPLYSFRALRQTQEQRQQQRRQQQEQLLIVCHRRLLKSSRVNSSRTFLSEAQKQWQSPVQMLDTRSIMSGLSSQQPSLLHVTGAQACISSRSSSASQPYCSPPPT